MLVINDYPVLKDIFWDWNEKTIDDKTAFELIERRWSFIDQEDLDNHEAALIEKLKDEYGNGLMLTA